MRVFVAFDAIFAAGWFASQSAVGFQHRNCLSLKAIPGAFPAQRVCDYNPSLALGCVALAVGFLVAAALAFRSWRRRRHVIAATSAASSVTVKDGLHRASRAH